MITELRSNLSRRRSGRRAEIASTAVLLAAIVLAPAAPARGEDAGARGPILSLDEAVEMAYRRNPGLVSTTRPVAEAEQRAAALRTRRLPALHVDGYAGRLLNSLDFTVPAGALGSEPLLGPVPPKDSTATAAADWFATATVSASQPLTQQYRIGLGLDAMQLDRRIAEEDVRRERNRIASDVRTTYYQISASEVGVEAVRDLVRAVEELDAVTSRYFTEDMVIRSDALEVKARLARERQRLAAMENRLATQRESLNQLLGRDVQEPFRIVKPADLRPRAAALTLEAARARAVAARPEIRSLALRADQADTARRIANSFWIPDLSLTAAYTRFVNIKSLPDEVATVGLTLSWEPFDWGRKQHEARERALQGQQARDAQQSTRDQIEVEVGHRWRALQDAAALLDATRLEEEASTESLDTDRNRYRENATILRDLLRTEARLSDARREYTDALAGYWSAAAELERTIGDEN